MRCQGFIYYIKETVNMKMNFVVLNDLPHNDAIIRFKVSNNYMHGFYYCTRRFIGEGLILAIGDFSENSPILKLPILITTWTRPQSHCRNSKRKTW